MKHSTIRMMLAMILLSQALLSSASAAQLPLTIDTQQWSLVLGNALTERDEPGLGTAQRRLLSDLQPLIESQDYQGAADLFAAHPDVDDWRLLRLKGQVWLALERYDEAGQVFDRVLIRQPDDRVTLQNMVTLNLQQERLSEAREYLTRSLSAGVQNAQIYGQLGYINLMSASPHSAIHAYQSALMFEPQRQQWLQGLLYALVQAKSPEQGWFVLEKLLENDSDNAQLWLQRAQLALDSERNTAAIASLEAAFELGYDDAQTMLQAARLHLQHGSPQRAVELIGLASAEPLNEPGLFNQIEQIAYGLVQQRSWPPLAQLLETLQTDALNQTQHATLDYFRAELALLNGDETGAIEALESAERRHPTHGPTLLKLAELYQTQGDEVQAELKFQRAVALPEVSQQARMGLAQLAIDQRNYDQALAQLRELYREDPNQANLLQNIRTLERFLNDS